MGHSQPLFLYFRLFNTQLRVNKCSMYSNFFADDWIRTVDLWYWKRPLYQLSHNHCPVYHDVRLWTFGDGSNVYTYNL